MEHQTSAGCGGRHGEEPPGARPLALVAFAAALVTGCTNDRVEAVPAYQLGEAVPVSAAETDSAWIGRATGFTVRGPRIAVADPSRSMVHLLNRSTGAWRRLGREGRGPGEYSGFIAVAYVGDELWVGNVDNRRLDRYSADGELLASVRADLPVTFAADAHGNPVVRALDLEHLLTVISEDGIRRVGPLDSLPSSLGGVDRMTFMRPDFIELAPIGDGRFVIAEVYAGTLWAATLSGNDLELTEIELPAEIRRQLAEGTEQLDAMFPGTQAPALRNMHSATDGTVWVSTVPRAGPVLALEIDPEEGGVRRMLVKTEHPGLRKLHDTVLRGDTLFYVSETDVGAYRIRRVD